MAGARPSGFKASGGFLNNVDGVIANYVFSPDFPGQEGKERKGEFNPLYFILNARLDGSTADVQTTLFAGSADDFDISDDGRELIPHNAEDGIRGGTPFADFLASLCKPLGGGDGFPEDRLPEDEINYSAIVGTRVRFVQVQEVDKKTGKPRVRTATKGKYKGKEFAQTTTAIQAVYELPNAGKKATASKSAKPATTTKAAAASSSDDVSNKAVATLKAILADQEDGTIAKSKLSMQVLQKLTKDKDREAVRKLVYKDDFLATVDGIDYDTATQLLVLLPTE